jgi:hypothetical protein
LVLVLAADLISSGGIQFSTVESEFFSGCMSVVNTGTFNTGQITLGGAVSLRSLDRYRCRIDGDFTIDRKGSVDKCRASGLGERTPNQARVPEMRRNHSRQRTIAIAGNSISIRAALTGCALLWATSR